MSIQLKVIIFVLASAGLVWVSWPSLRSLRFHGLYRFLAWEAIVVLFLLNLDVWFAAPFSIHQLVSWGLLTVSLVLVGVGVQLLRGAGQPDDAREDASLLGFEKTTELVTTGLYRYIRHPLYSSLLFLTWGVFFKRLAWVGVAVAGLATVFLVMTVRIEEAENIRFFGDDYRHYMKRTKMFIPYLF